MTLKDALLKYPKKKLVRIGANRGRGFVYSGKIGNIQWDDLNDRFFRSLPESKRQEYTILEDREIVDEYPSLRWQSIELFIFEGDECQDYSHGGEYPLPDLTEISPFGLENLSTSIYHQAVKDYYYACIELKDTRAKYVDAVQNISRLEKYLRDDVLGVIDDPESVIEFTRKKVFGETMT